MWERIRQKKNKCKGQKKKKINQKEKGIRTQNAPVRKEKYGLKIK